MITEAQRLERKNSIGASDSAAILGLNPWKSNLELFHEKRGEIEDADLSGNEAVRLGNLFEPIIVKEACRQIGYDNICLVTDPTMLFRVSKEHDFITCNLDAFIPYSSRRPILIEAKYSAHGDNWGEVGTDQVPYQYWVQCQHQLYVTDADVCYLCRMNPNFGITFDLYRIDRNEEAIQALVDEIVNFWKLVKETPAGEVPASLSNDRLSLDALKRFKREYGKGIELSGGVDLEIDFFNHQKELAKKHKALEDGHKAVIIQSLGNADSGKTPDGRLITYYADKNGNRTLRIKEAVK